VWGGGGVGQSLSIALHNLHYLAQERGVAALPPLDEDAERNLVLNQNVMLTSSVVCVGVGNVARDADGAAVNNSKVWGQRYGLADCLQFQS
jgi:hypothetical protein